MSRYFVSTSDNRLAFIYTDDDAPADMTGLIEVPSRPPGATPYYTWDGSQWVRDADTDDRKLELDIDSAFTESRVARLFFELNFDQENRLRALEGSPSITRIQYRDALKARLSTL